MTDRVRPVPEGVHTVTPRLVFDDAGAAIDFYRETFGAEVPIEPHTGPGDKIVHAEIRIGDSLVYVTDEDDTAYGAAPPATGGRVTAIMSITVPDVDQLWDRAVPPAAKSSSRSRTSSTATAPGASAIRSVTSGC